MKTPPFDKNDELRKWINNHPALNIKALEQLAKLPDTTLAHFMGGRDLPKKHWPALYKVLKEYGYT